MKILFHDKKFLFPVITDLYSGWRAQTKEDELEIVEARPKLVWKGAKMSFELWCHIVGFLRWTQKEFKEEAMLTLFYNTKEKTWAAWPFPQEPNGMSIRLLHSHPLYKTDRMQFGADWLQAGSIHHHCTSGAFQSGTDTADEQDRDGVHITLGKMTEATLDIHIRAIFDNLQGETHISDWVDTPVWLNQSPKWARYFCSAFSFVNIPEGDFPEEWKSRVLKKIPSYGYQYNGTHGNHNVHQSQGSTVITKNGNTNSTGSTENTTPPTATTAPQGQQREFAHWGDALEARLFDLLKRTPISTSRAYKVLSTMEHSKLDSHEQCDRAELIAALLKENIPILYAESILENHLTIGVGFGE